MRIGLVASGTKALDSGVAPLAVPVWRILVPTEDGLPDGYHLPTCLLNETPDSATTCQSTALPGTSKVRCTNANPYQLRLSHDSFAKHRSTSGDLELFIIGIAFG